MDYRKELEALKEKIQAETDVTKAEQYHREVRNELILKRDQVAQLKQQLANANSKIFHMNRELEVTKSLLTESEFNLKLATQKSKSLEEKYKEMNQDYVTLKLREEMRLTEVQILKDKEQKVAFEKEQLERETQDLKNKLQFSQNFQEELEQRQNVLNGVASKIKENIKVLEQEQLRVTEIGHKLQTSEEAQQTNIFLTEQVRKLEKEKTDMENELIETNAKYETLRCLMTKDGKIDDIIQKLKFLQYEDRCKKLAEKNNKHEELIATMAAALQRETATNAKLIAQIEEYEARL